MRKQVRSIFFFFLPPSYFQLLFCVSECQDYPFGKYLHFVSRRDTYTQDFNLVHVIYLLFISILKSDELLRDGNIFTLTKER